MKIEGIGDIIKDKKKVDSECGNNEIQLDTIKIIFLIPILFLFKFI